MKIEIKGIEFYKAEIEFLNKQIGYLKEIIKHKDNLINMLKENKRGDE
jgi:prefoldin subunit 5